ncbi:helix-turn-helix domain-containing protein [Aquimarina algicola]|uniref:AraC family transcriptional regulator n=1 Tax=Aquimarina algicola TaxID=2589995 RepID=A0A504J8L5_9FLAO|nr:helix-turn-helix domain-containing protein [Aquimarina algicola]TPN83893.1 AraC family transcriptional regulator [Aquimarina algicola]
MLFYYGLTKVNAAKHLYFILILLLNSISIFAFQSDNDSLRTKKYEYLTDKVFQNAKDSSIAIIYARSYLNKAKEDNDTLKIANGFYYFSGIIKDKELTEKYVDSMLLYSKNLKNKTFPALAYFYKAKIEYNKGNYKKALELYLKTNKKAEEFENTHIFYASKKSIGIIKSRIGEHETSLYELKECYQYYSKLKSEKPRTYLSTLFALSDVYHLNNKLDSASKINRMGYKESVFFEQNDFRYYFTLNEGINLFSKKDFIGAQDSLSVAIKEFNSNNDKANLSMAYFYLGKTLAALGDEKKSIESHIKVDEIFRETYEIMPNNRENYEILINHYKKQDDKDNQLKYIQQLLKVDSVLNTNYKYLIKTIIKEYDTPKLLSEKQKIITSLEDKKQVSNTTILILLGVSILLLILWLINRNKQRQYKKRFEDLYNKQTSQKKEQQLLEKEKPSLSIPQEIIKDILSKLTVFENELGFIQSNLTVHNLAKEFGTNSKYLSKIINTYKKKSFNYYINDLRIEQSIIRLKTDSKFRNYTIRAIAKEIGFKTTDTFSKAFYRKNGIYPSYFIKELEKQLETEEIK